jgi:tRNA threonylcarbamoyladenosine biosynthesis protein TsaB
MTPPLLAVCGSNLTGDVPFSVALAAGAVERVRTSPPGGRGDLAALVAALCADAGLAPDAIRTVRVDVGPGSYTGLRVACTFVRFLQHFGGVAVEAVDSLALLAARARAPGTAPRRVHAVLDARRDRVHWQPFDVTGEAVTAAAPATAVALPQLLGALGAGALVVAPAASPAALLAALRAHGADLHAATAVTAAAMLAAGLPFAAATTADLEPRYLMGSYAET